MKIPTFPGKYNQNGGFSMAMLVYRRVSPKKKRDMNLANPLENVPKSGRNSRIWNITKCLPNQTIPYKKPGHITGIFGHSAYFTPICKKHKESTQPRKVRYRIWYPEIFFLGKTLPSPGTAVRNTSCGSTFWMAADILWESQELLQGGPRAWIYYGLK